MKSLLAPGLRGLLVDRRQRRINATSQLLLTSTALVALLLSGRAAGGDLAAAALAAERAATSAAECTDIQSFYWEIGNRSDTLVSGTRGTAQLTVDTEVPLYSAGKWIYGAYVAGAPRQEGSALSATDIRSLTMRSGYTQQGQCPAAENVAACLNQTQGVNAGSMNQRSTESVDRFSYGPAHFQQHADAVMQLGSHNAARLATTITSALGGGFGLSYSSPHLGGGARASASHYALFLQKLLRGELALSTLLGTSAVCTATDAAGCGALRSPSVEALDEPWHYSLGHWVEDAPGIGDGAFSSAGAAGFYPWIDTDRQFYGILSRNVLGNTSAAESVRCGRQIRKAFLDALGPEAGLCGIADGAITQAFPDRDLCSAGTVGITDSEADDDEFNWRCKGYRGGATASCAAALPRPDDGACGSASGRSSTAFPDGSATELCAAGTQTTTDSNGNDGYFNWSCFGVNGGARASCSAPKILDGRCGAATKTKTSDYPVAKLCSVGKAAATDAKGNDGSFNWACRGLNGGITATCAAPRVADGACGQATKTKAASYPKSKLCSVGKPAATDSKGNDGSFNWACRGFNGGASTSCAAPSIVNGSCGPAANTATASYPAAKLCRSGKASKVDATGDDGSFNWTCRGLNGGTAASCAAPKSAGGS